MTRRTPGAVLFGLIVAAAAAAPFLTPHSPVRQFAGFENVPPMPVHLITPEGRLHRPFVYPPLLVDRLERRYAEDRSRPSTLRWFTSGTLVSTDDGTPWFPLGTDPLGRDVLARLVHGARLSLGVALVSTLGALLAGMLVGGTAGFAGGRTDTVLMAAADFILVLPAIYVVLAFRAALPLVLSVGQVFWALVLVLSLAAWPIAARGVRAIVAAERRREYAEAAYALGAGPLRILLRHLLPATAGFLTATAQTLLPSFILLEGTMSLVGLGFPVPAATWGTMMRDAWQGGALTEAPWLLAPAGMIFVTLLSVYLLSAGKVPESPRAGLFS